MDWSRCTDVESKPDVVSGAFVVRGTRVQADALVANAQEGFSPEEIVGDIFPSVSLDSARRILTFAGVYEPRPA